VGRIEHKKGTLNKIRQLIPHPMVQVGFGDSIPIIIVRKKPINIQQIRKPREEFHENDRFICWWQVVH